MKTCPKCGQTWDDSASFCTSCGSPLASAAPQAAPFCPVCGQRLEEGAAFCVYCGAQLNGAQPQGTQWYPAPGGQPDPGAQYAGPIDGFCTNCGESIPAGSMYCPNCFAPVQPQQPGKKPKSGKSKKVPVLIASISAAAVVLIVAAVLLIPRLFKSPEKTFVATQKEIFVTPLLSAMETEMDTYGSGQFSSDVTISASVDSPQINRYLSNSSIVLKMDMTQDRMLINGDLVLMGSPILSGALTYEDGVLGFCLPEFDDHYYVMDLSAMLSSMGLPGMDLSGSTPLPEFSGRQWTSLIETYLDLAATAVTRDSLTVDQNRSYRLPELGGTYTGTVYTFKPTVSDVQAMLIKLADHLERDNDLRSAILSLMDADTLQAFMGSLTGSSYYGYGYGTPSIDPEPMVDETLRAMASQLRLQAQYMDPTYDPGITWTLCMEGSELRMVRIETAYGEAIAFERTGTPSSGCSQVLYEEYRSQRHVFFQNSYTKNGHVYTGSVTLNGGSYSALSVNYSDVNTDMRSVLGIPYGTYSLSVPYEGVNLSLAVSEGRSGSTDHVITVQDSGYTFGGEFSRLELTINTTSRSSAQRPSQRSTDITNYSYEELDQLFSNLASRIQSGLYGIVYGW